jgi:16S rRNA (uracil1498-N3)-methyltransferase
MPRFFLEKDLEENQRSVKLLGDDAHHIQNVLRQKTGDEILLCSSSGLEHICRIKEFLPGQVILSVESSRVNQTEPAYHVTLYQGLAKGDKLDMIVQKAVELGVFRIVPVKCQRSVVQLDPADAARKTARWSRIAAAAAKQCGRGRIPQVAEPLDFTAAVAEASQAAIRLLPWEAERKQGIRAFLEKWPEEANKQPLTISLIIGPEGGFTEDEAALAVQSGFQAVTLGQRILRTETAGLAVLAMLAYRFDRL